MRKIPVLFSAPMVQAILREIREPGTGKTMTRRLLYTPRNGIIPASATMLQGHQPPSAFSLPIEQYWTLSGWEKVKPGDLLWVRETWRSLDMLNKVKPVNLTRRADVPIWYEADGDYEPSEGLADTRGKIRTAIHMPEKYSRITCTVTAVRIERLQKISEADAKAEGTELTEIVRNHQVRHASHRAAFAALWTRLHGQAAWDENPEVVVVSFRPALENVAYVAARLAA